MTARRCHRAFLSEPPLFAVRPAMSIYYAKQPCLPAGPERLSRSLQGSHLSASLAYPVSPRNMDLSRYREIWEFSYLP
ncbi:hypothetical protein NDU88_006622 [Pleurodeles waltl]|uniref:Uncharacterized protein n=1 Tax=Pleurodeles waltl TaxID=8319 RepID=A0AAV7PIZ1_PLEWA|nr:hypothetical protein NDU88_006622 [Pleurodeles waltl]